MAGRFRVTSSSSSSSLSTSSSSSRTKTRREMEGEMLAPGRCTSEMTSVQKRFGSSSSDYLDRQVTLTARMMYFAATGNVEALRRMHDEYDLSSTENGCGDDGRHGLFSLQHNPTCRIFRDQVHSFARSGGIYFASPGVQSKCNCNVR